ncbi:MAG: bis(5'-nucleosidyl)-tetraphosphatase [Crocinitomicaceae bacterium]|jgi:bis(5'-nucleosidyl)-tetraphosphatase
MRYRVSCGVIPVHINTNGKIRFLLVQGHGDYWGFPKGHKEGNETHLQTAIRELQEETQLVADSFFGNTIFTERYRIPKKRGSDIIKKVIYFIGIISDTRVVRQTTELKNHGWFSFEDAQSKLLENRVVMLSELMHLLEKNT